MSNKSMAGNSSSRSSSCCCCCYMLLLLLCMLLPAMPNAAAAAATRRARITANHNATTLTQTKLKTSTDGSNNNNNNSNSNNIADSKYEIRGVAGEPNYKSVNLTWEVEFVTSAHDTDTKRNANTNTNTIVNVDGVTNMSVGGGVGGVDVEPPKAFQIFYCEIQNYGAQRCRVKLVNATAATVAATDVATNELLTTQQAEDHVDSSHVQHFAAAVDNLRMATRYSFHIRPVQSRRLRSSSARSELFNAEDNEIEGAATSTHLPGQSIVIPTKGFSAHATQCLAHASEIEVETGPYFGGLIVVDGGDCGIKGNPNDPADKYTMRIDHKQCGSMVKPETNTVETFITVQENLGIFTHSTRRFVVVCSYQSGMQTVRASFTVPGKNGVAAAIESNDPFQPDDERLGREMRNMRFVNKSELVLKESEQESEELPALVMETSPPEKPKQEQLTQAKEPKGQQQRMQGRALSLASLNELNSLAVRDVESVEPPAQLSTKYAKLVVEQGTADANDANANDDDDDEFYVASLRYISANLGSVLVTVSISVIIISICIVLLLQQRHRLPNYNYNNQQRNSNNNNKLQSHLAKLGCPAAAHLPHKTLPRALQQQYQCTL